MPAFVNCIVVIVAALSCSWAIALAAPSSDFSHYYYFKERRPLHLDASRLAILDSGAVSTNQVRGFLQAAGFEDPTLLKQSLAGWSLFQVASASGTAELVPGSGSSGAESVDELIAELIGKDQDERFFFAPVFTSDFGVIIPTPNLLVQFGAAVTETQIEKLMHELGMGTSSRSPLGTMKNTFVVQPGSRSGVEVLKLANQLALQPEVVAAEADMLFDGRSSFIPNDPNFSASWGLHNTGELGGTPDVDINAPESWDRNTGSGGVFTIIIDTGVDEFHPDLHQLGGIDVTFDEGHGGPVNACDNHGTAVAGFVGSRIDNGLGTVGVAPSAWILSARTFISSLTCDGSWSSLSSWTVDTLNWAQSINARVTNNSNSYGFQSSIIAAKYQETRDAGMVHFGSAGNRAVQEVGWPAALPSVHAITAITSSGNLASFSSWGAEASFTGPGENLFTTDRTGFDGWTRGDYIAGVGGTSYSTPMIAGVAALLISEASSLEPDEVDALLRASSVDLGASGWDPVFGWGLPKGDGALEALDLFSNSFESGDTSKWSSATP